MTAGTTSAQAWPPDVADGGLKNGAFVVNYSGLLSHRELQWLRRFERVVTGAALPLHATAGLRCGPRELFFYHWATGLYATDSMLDEPGTQWLRRVRRGGADWLLNTHRPLPGPDNGRPAYYLDPGSAAGNEAWAEWVSATRKRFGYHGVFLDLLGEEHLQPAALGQFRSNHPDIPFATALGSRLRVLKKHDPGLLVFSNQAYRNPTALLPLVDLDLTESLMTSYAWGTPVVVRLSDSGIARRSETYFRPWAELERIVDGIVDAAKLLNPRLRILHLNYLNPSFRPIRRHPGCTKAAPPMYEEIPDREAIHFSHAAAKLWGHDNHVLCPAGVHFAQDDVEFVDLGNPLAEREEAGRLICRYFERGLVVVNPGDRPRKLRPDDGRLPQGSWGLWDCFDRRRTSLAPLIRPAVAPVSGETRPSGRIFLYLN